MYSMVLVREKVRGCTGLKGFFDGVRRGGRGRLLVIFVLRLRSRGWVDSFCLRCVESGVYVFLFSIIESFSLQHSMSQ